VIRAVTCLLALVLMAGATPAVAQDAASLSGFWMTDVRRDAPRGDIDLRESNGVWAARFDGVEAQGRAATDGELLLRFPEAAFRGRVSAGAARIDGFWITMGDHGQQLATPLTLHRAAHRQWRGAATPLDLRFTLYARIFAREDGVLIAAFRNPQRNTTGGGPRLFVSRDKDIVRFSERNDGAGGIMHEARLETPDRLRLFWPQAGETLFLERVSQARAAGFFPRPPGAGAYRYAQPAQTGDGWRTARAQETGFDEGALSHVVVRIAEADPSARRPQLVHSLLVARRGRLVLEEYFYGAGREEPHDLRSAGKTFASVLLGAAMRDDASLSPQTPILAAMAARGPFANPSPAKSRITLAHLMTHTSGLACDDADESSPGGEDAMQGDSRATDWLKYALDLPVRHEPGVRYAYCSAGMNLVGGALAARTSTWLPELFARKIARPLDFGPWAWNLAPDGAGYLGGGARLRARDLLKVGQVFLDGGVWRGRRILDRAWVTESTTPRALIDETTTGLSSEAFRNTYAGGADGYAWHAFEIEVNGRKFREYEAAGNGGQILAVVPELDLAVVLTGGAYNNGHIWSRWRDEIIAHGVAAAVVD